MSESTPPARELVVTISHGIDHELSSIGFTIANGGMTSGLTVTVFLVSSAVDIVRRRGADATHVQPFEALAALVSDFLRRGGALYACTPCVKARGYQQQDLIDGVVISGASVIHERIARGAGTLSF